MDSLMEINFNYHAAIKQAKRLDEIAASLEKLADQEMERVLNEIGHAWKSELSAPKFLQKGRKVETDISKTAGNLRNIATSVRTIAERVRSAELEALRIANTRTS